MHVAVAEAGEAPRRPFRHTVAIVDQDDAAGDPWHQARHVEFEPAVGQVDRQQRVALAVLPFLADIDKGDLAAVAQPFPDGRDVDGLWGCGHGALPMRVSSTNCSVAASIARPRRPRGGWI